MSLAALIERLEKCTGPDRELDLAIHVAIDPDGNIAHVTQEYPRGLNHQEGYAWDFYQKSIVYEKWTSDGRCPVNGGYPLPEYTALIDAAMTLVLPGWFIRITQIRFGMWHCELWRGDKSTREIPDAESVAASEPLARATAALKSRDVTP